MKKRNIFLTIILVIFMSLSFMSCTSSNNQQEENKKNNMEENKKNDSSYSILEKYNI